MTQFAACHYDLDVSGWMDVTDLYRILAVMGQEVDLPFGPCAPERRTTPPPRCEPVASTDGVGDGLNNLNPEYFDLNGDGTLNVTDFELGGGVWQGLPLKRQVNQRRRLGHR